MVKYSTKRIFNYGKSTCAQKEYLPMVKYRCTKRIFTYGKSTGAQKEYLPVVKVQVHKKNIYLW